jgi:hypothetical protein
MFNSGLLRSGSKSLKELTHYPAAYSMPPVKVALALMVATLLAVAQTASSELHVPKPGVPGVQVPFASLKPSATIKIGGTADWVLITDDAVWVASTKPYAVLRIDPVTNKIVAAIKVSGEVCSDLASGFGSIWAPLCGKKSSLVRIDAAKNLIIATLPTPPAGPEGGITTSEDSVWIVSDKNGTLNRIDPSTNNVRQKISIPPGSYNPLFSNGIVWITGVVSSVFRRSLDWKVTGIDARCAEASLSYRRWRFGLDPQPRRWNRQPD